MHNMSFVFSALLSAEAEIAHIKANMDFISSKTCVTFEEGCKADGTYNIVIKKGNGCWSYIGMYTSDQPLSIGGGCFTDGIIQHELLHALGFFHEHSRRDRDEHLIVHYNNVMDCKNYLL